MSDFVIEVSWATASLFFAVVTILCAEARSQALRDGPGSRP